MRFALAFIILIILASCTNIAGKQIALPDKTCVEQGGKLCPLSGYCSGELLDSIEGTGTDARCCVLGECTQAVELSASVEQPAELIAADAFCNLFVFDHGMIYHYTEDLVRSGGYIDKEWKADAPFPTGISDARHMEISDGDYLIASGLPPQGVRLSFRRGILKSSSWTYPARESEGKWLWTTDGSTVDYYFQSPYVDEATDQGLTYFVDPERKSIVRFDGDRTDLLPIPAEHVSASAGLLYTSVGNSILVYDAGNMRFLFRTAIASVPDQIASCKGKFFISTLGRITSYSINLKN